MAVNNPFPSLMLGNEDDEDDGVEDSLLQLTGQEEATLPGFVCGADRVASLPHLITLACNLSAASSLSLVFCQE
jgi:hypothetical protein